jgi:oxygen-independent coproporphyrinogen-3 oxidase
VGHVSLYILEAHAGTPLADDLAAGRTRLPSDRALEAAYLAAVDRLASLGLRQYEVANFARPGEESRHNRAYWNGAPYLGLGPGAHGYWGRRRYANHADPETYCREVESGRLPEAMVDPLDRAARRLEAAILPLRTSEGVALARVPAGALPLERGEREGLWAVAAGRLRLTAKGFLRIDAIESALARALQARAPVAGDRAD